MSWDQTDIELAKRDLKRKEARRMRAIVVTIPKSRLKQVEQEEAEVQKAIARGKKDICYFWTIPTEPAQRVERIYFVWNGAVRAYHEIIEIIRRDNVKVYMKPEIHTLLEPIPMKGFQGWRYFEVPR